MSTIAERVAAGVAWLDDNVLGWQNRVVVESLEMASVCRCVLGQIYGTFYEAPLDVTGARAAALGFDLTADAVDGPSEFMSLAAEWRRVITERRAAP